MISSSLVVFFQRTLWPALWGFHVSGSWELGLFYYLIVFLYLSLMFSLSQNCPISPQFDPMILPSIYATLFKFSLCSQYEREWCLLPSIGTPSQWLESQHTALPLPSSHLQWLAWRADYSAIDHKCTSIMRLPFYGYLFLQTYFYSQENAGHQAWCLEHQSTSQKDISTPLQPRPF